MAKGTLTFGWLSSSGIGVLERRDNLDVDTFVKSSILTLAFLAASAHSIAKEIHVFGVGIKVHENCEVIVTDQKKQSRIFPLASSAIGKCRILFHNQTDIPRIEFIQGEYVFLVENVVNAAESCRATLFAVTINRSGRVRMSPGTPGTSACGAAERKDFEILRFRSGK